MMSHLSPSLIFRVEGSSKEKKVSGRGKISDIMINAGFKIDLPCGGKGTCGKCRIKILSQAPEPDEYCLKYFSKHELDAGFRLACRIEARDGMFVEIPKTVLLDESEKTGTLYKNIYEKTSVSVVDPDIFKKNISYKFTVENGEGALTDIFLKDAGFDREVSLQVQALRKLPFFINHSETPFAAVVKYHCDGKYEVIDLINTNDLIYGVAVDIGTTSIAASLVDLTNGQVLVTKTISNSQKKFGADYISRIDYARKSWKNLERLEEAVCDDLSSVIKQLSVSAHVNEDLIYSVVLSGNTVMEHLALGVDPVYLGALPFLASFSKEVLVTPFDIGLGINESAQVIFLPNIRSYIGADITAGILFSNFDQMVDEKALLVDIGTNGEIAVRTPEKILVASAAAGPAFEGGNISCGMNAADGAVIKIFYDDNKNDLGLKSYGESLPCGIAGTALIDLVALLKKYQIIDETGRLSDPEKPPVNPVNRKLFERIVYDENHRLAFNFSADSDNARLILKQKDIRELQMAKSAIYTTIEFLLEKADISLDLLDHLYIAGTFGMHLNYENSRDIGLLPKVQESKVVFLGNSSLEGTKQVLCSKKERVRSRAIPEKCGHIEIASDPQFQEKYMDHMYF